MAQVNERGNEASDTEPRHQNGNKPSTDADIELKLVGDPSTTMTGHIVDRAIRGCGVEAQIEAIVGGECGEEDHRQTDEDDTPEVRPDMRSTRRVDFI